MTLLVTTQQPLRVTTVETSKVIILGIIQGLQLEYLLVITHVTMRVTIQGTLHEDLRVTTQEIILVKK